VPTDKAKHADIKKGLLPDRMPLAFSESCSNIFSNDFSPILLASGCDLLRGCMPACTSRGALFLYSAAINTWINFNPFQMLRLQLTMAILRGICDRLSGKS
jgi:hypothetical protein